jgi:hypothetical protein
VWAIFSAAGPALHRPRPISKHELSCHPITTLPSLIDETHHSGPSSPNPPCSAPVCSRRPNSRCRFGHPLSARTTSMSICRHELSHRLLIPRSIASTLPAALLPPVAAPHAKPPHSTSLPVRRSQTFTRAQSCSATRRTGTFTAVELRCYRPRWSALILCRLPSSLRFCTWDHVRQVRRGPWMLPMDFFARVVQSSAVTGSATPCTSAAHCAPCGLRRGLSTAFALGHTVAGGAPSLGSSTMCNLAIR